MLGNAGSFHTLFLTSAKILSTSYALDAEWPISQSLKSVFICKSVKQVSSILQIDKSIS
jgi:hypothetical protein